MFLKVISKLLKKIQNYKKLLQLFSQSLIHMWIMKRISQINSTDTIFYMFLDDEYEYLQCY